MSVVVLGENPASSNQLIEYSSFMKSLAERYDGDGIDDANGSPVVAYLEIVKNKGSSLIFSAHGWWGKEKNHKPAEKIAVRSESAAEGGCGGNSASLEPKRSHAALLVQSRTQQKSFLLLLEEKIGRAQNKKYRENFFAGWRASASGGGAERQFRSKKFRAKFRISHK